MQRTRRTRDFGRDDATSGKRVFRPVKERAQSMWVPFICIRSYSELFLASRPEANWSPLEDPLFAHIGRFANDLFVHVYARLSVVRFPRLPPPHHPQRYFNFESTKWSFYYFKYVRTRARVCVQICFFLYLSCVPRVNLDTTLWLRLVARFHAIPPAYHVEGTATVT